MSGLRGNLLPLFARQRARDLFDCSPILAADLLGIDRLRTAFVVYGAMNRRNWRMVSLDDVSFDPAELSAQLLPALRRGALHDILPGSYGEKAH